MAQLQLPPQGSIQIAGQIYAHTSIGVEVSSSWPPAWVPVKYLQPLNAVDSCAPSIGRAMFLLNFGRIKREDATSFSQSYDVNVLDFYVRIRNLDRGNTLWTGILSADTLKPHGGESGSGDQQIEAYALTYLLDRQAITQVKAACSGGANKYIGRVPQINERFPHGVFVYGNRSSAQDADGAYVFSSDNQTWTFQDVANMLLTRHTPASGPTFVLGGQQSVLATISDVVRIEGRTTWDVLNEMINRNRGIGFAPVVDDVAGVVMLYVYTILDQDVASGSVKIPANDQQMSLLLDDDISIETPSITRMTSWAYDRIEVRGKPILSTFTVSYLDGTLEEGYSATLKTSYDLAASDPDPDVNDRYRDDDLFQDVYVKHRVPMAWAGSVGNGTGQGQRGPALPYFTDSGELKLDGNLYRQGKKFETFLPFISGYDYTTTPPTNNALSDAEQTYVRPFAIVQDPTITTKYYFVDTGAPALEVGSGGSTAHFTGYPRELAIGVVANPRYMYALNHFDPTGNTSGQSIASDVPIFDYKTLIATVAMRTDDVVRVVAGSDVSSNAIVRTKVIQIESAEFWYVVPGTIVGVNFNNSATPLKQTAGGILRDDRPRLQAIAAFAMSWYGQERAMLSVTVRRIDAIAPLGALLNSAFTAGEEVAVGTVVTSIAYDFGYEQRTTVQTQWAEIDFNAATLPGETAPVSKGHAGTGKVNHKMERAEMEADE